MVQTHHRVITKPMLSHNHLGFRPKFKSAFPLWRRVETPRLKPGDHDSD